VGVWIFSPRKDFLAWNDNQAPSYAKSASILPANRPESPRAISMGYYRGKDLIYVARTRNGFLPASRRRVFEKLKPLVIPTCPFINLPETHKARWGEALTAEKMKKCVWVKPEIVAQVEFLEWTDADHLRHSKFVGLRDDKDARNVVKE
jgi:ATP-dependent DNA ligase